MVSPEIKIDFELQMQDQEEYHTYGTLCLQQPVDMEHHLQAQLIQERVLIQILMMPVEEWLHDANYSLSVAPILLEYILSDEETKSDSDGLV